MVELNSRRVLLALLTLVTASSVSADTLSGVVTTTGGIPVEGANIDFIDATTGVNVLITGDTTNALGQFTATGPAGLYDITVTPSLASGLIGHKHTNINVSGASSLPNTLLAAGYRFDAVVTDMNGTPVNGADFSIQNAALVKPFIARNTSDATGTVVTYIPTSGGPWTLTWRPPAGLGFAEKGLLNFAPAGDVNLGNIFLGPARNFTARAVRFSNSAAVPNTNLDFFDASGLELKLGGVDLADSSGNFAITGLTDGIYQVFFRPPVATGLTRKEFRLVEVRNNLAMGDVKLGVIRTVTGTVRNTSAAPIPAIDLDFTDQAYGLQAELNNDNSIANGTFSIETTDGVYQIDFRPPAATPYAPKTLFNVSVVGNVNLGTIVLGNYVTLSGTTKDQSGANLVGVDLDVIDPATGGTVFTPNDLSVAGGTYAARLAEGTWTLRYKPPFSRPDLLPVQYDSQNIAGNTTRNVVFTSLLTEANSWELYE